MGRGSVTLVFSELITNTHRPAETARARSLSSQCLVRADRLMPSLPQPAAGGLPPRLLGQRRRGLQREQLGQATPKAVVIEGALDSSGQGQGDATGLLRHHEDDLVRL